MVCFLFSLLISALLKKRLLHHESLFTYGFRRFDGIKVAGALRAFFLLANRDARPPV